MKKITTLVLSAISSMVLAQIPNPSFENWSVGNPTQWNTTNSIYAGTVTQSSNAYAGSSAVELNVVSGIGGVIATGKSLFAQNYFVNSGNPTALTGWYILNSVGNDGLSIIALTKCANDSVSRGNAMEDSITTTVYKQFTLCLFSNYNCTPDSASIMLALENSVTNVHSGSYVIIDDLSWSTCTTAVEPISNYVTIEPAYPNPANDICNIIYSLPNSALVNVALYDINGRQVIDILNNTNQTSGRYKIPVDVCSLANGVYIYTITVNGVPYSQKLTITK